MLLLRSRSPSSRLYLSWLVLMIVGLILCTKQAADAFANRATPLNDTEPKEYNRIRNMDDMKAFLSFESRLDEAMYSPHQNITKIRPNMTTPRPVRVLGNQTVRKEKLHKAAIYAVMRMPLINYIYNKTRAVENGTAPTNNGNFSLKSNSSRVMTTIGDNATGLSPTPLPLPSGTTQPTTEAATRPVTSALASAWQRHLTQAQCAVQAREQPTVKMQSKMVQGQSKGSLLPPSPLSMKEIEQLVDMAILQALLNPRSAMQLPDLMKKKMVPPVTTEMAVRPKIEPSTVTLAEANSPTKYEEHEEKEEKLMQDQPSIVESHCTCQSD